MSFIKNIDKSQVLTLKDEVSYQKGQVVSKTLAQNDALSVTLFAFDKDEEISTHESGGDAFVTCLDGVGRITIDGKAYELHEGESIIMPAKHPHAVYGCGILVVEKKRFNWKQNKTCPNKRSYCILGLSCGHFKDRAVRLSCRII